MRLDSEDAASIPEWVMHQSSAASSLLEGNDIDEIAEAEIHRFDLQTDPGPDRSL